MSARRDARLSPADLALKLAFRDAVRAAGGQEFVAGEIGRTQSRVSDWCNANVDEFPPIDIVRRVEALGAGAPGHPHVSGALARAAGGVLARDPEDLGAPLCAAGHLAAVAGESSDVIRRLADQVARRATLGPNARAVLLREIDDLLEAVMQLHCDVTREDGLTVTADTSVVPMQRSERGRE